MNCKRCGNILEESVYYNEGTLCLSCQRDHNNSEQPQHWEARQVFRYEEEDTQTWQEYLDEKHGGGG